MGNLTKSLAAKRDFRVKTHDRRRPKRNGDNNVWTAFYRQFMGEKKKKSL